MLFQGTVWKMKTQEGLREHFFNRAMQKNMEIFDTMPSAWQQMRYTNNKMVKKTNQPNMEPPKHANC